MAFKPLRLVEIVQRATAEATREATIATAKRMHGEVMMTAPRPGSFVRKVDGMVGAREEQVRAYGYIQYNYPRLEAVVAYAMEKLIEFSPVDVRPTKNEIVYRDSHTLFVGGVSVTDLTTWQPGMEIVIANPLPYARKIEVGKMKMVVSGTDRVYFRAEKAVRAQYGQIASIRFTYRGVAGGTGRGANRIDRDTRQPVLIIKEL